MAGGPTTNPARRKGRHLPTGSLRRKYSKKRKYTRKRKKKRGKK